MTELEDASGWREDTAAQAVALLAGPGAAVADPLTVARARLLATVGLLHGGSLDEAARETREIRDWAAVRGHDALHARAELRLSILYRRLGDPALSLEHALVAVQTGARASAAVLRAELLLGLADALGECGSSEEASRRYAEALESSQRLPGSRLTGVVLNNWAFTAFLTQDWQVSGDLADRLEHWAQVAGERLPLVAVDTVAQIRHALGSSQSAAADLRSGLDAAARDGAPTDVVAEALMTLARISRDVGDLRTAESSLARAETICREHSLAGLVVRGMAERAELLAAHGDFAGAYAVHKQFHGEVLELHAVRRETRARMLQATLQVDEARRESAHYREMSYRDPLTGLYNRRYTDEDLDRRLSGVAVPPALCVALVDLDHFKAVNDTCSHEVGDLVLRQLADLLEGCTADLADQTAYAARLGGEEFLLVLPGLQLDEAVDVAEALRRRVERFDWTALTSGVPVTSSIGVASTTCDAPDRPGLLRVADQRLYAAKQRGRNRVDAGAGASTPELVARPT